MNSSGIKDITSIKVVEEQIDAAKERIDLLRQSADTDKQRAVLTSLRRRLLKLFDKKFPPLKEIR